MICGQNSYSYLSIVNNTVPVKIHLRITAKKKKNGQREGL